MVDIMGHIAMGLLWTVPVWFVWTERVSLAFIGFAVVAALLPDIDRWLQWLVPRLVHHHGVVHTVAFVVASSVLGGAVVARALDGPIDRWLESERFDTTSLFVFAVAALLVGGLSHLFADMLSAPDVAQPIEPFWPVYEQVVSVDLLWYNSPWWNVGLLTVAVFLHLTIAYTSDTADHSYRIDST
ncbi:metal-dependent hydrolase [Natrinema sp. 74]|uniref:metal-dependent hydrolase n=1 Tax=Natrinema sp. 74 TaxID=3384159 RepID=UPI0038D41A5C